MIDRGFVKWHAFESICPNKETLQVLEENKKCKQPVLFPEEVSILTDSLMDAYYSKDVASINYYENGKIKNITSTIKKINPNSKTIELGCGKKLFWRQITHISS